MGGAEVGGGKLAPPFGKKTAAKKTTAKKKAAKK
jgi:hypothetical protein